MRQHLLQLNPAVRQIPLSSALFSTSMPRPAPSSLLLPPFRYNPLNLRRNLLVSNATANADMTHEANPPSTAVMKPALTLLKSSSPKRAPRKRPTALRGSLLASLNSTASKRASDETGAAERQRGRGTRKFSNKATQESRNVADDQANEVADLEERFDAPSSTQPPANAPAATPTAVDKRMTTSFSENDNSRLPASYVIRYENDPCSTAPYKALSAENYQLARRLDVLEAENSSLHRTRLVESERLRQINGTLAQQLVAVQQETRFWNAQSRMWESQALDRDGEVQRLRGLLMDVDVEGRFGGALQ